MTQSQKPLLHVYPSIDCDNWILLHVTTVLLCS